MISVHAGGLVNKKAVLLVLGQSLPAPGEGKREGEERKKRREREREKDHPNNQEAQERFSVLQTAIQEFD